MTENSSADEGVNIPVDSDTSDSEVENANESPTEGEMNEDTAASAGDSGVEPEESIESLKSKLVEAEAAVKDAAIRAQAEIQNIRRRTERDVASAHKFGQEKLIKDMLAVVDSLERGMQMIDEQNEDGADPDKKLKSIKEGSELTLKMFVDALAKHGVVQLDPVGEPFNPEFHEAMSMVENPDAEPNSVMAVMQKGYTLNERSIRAAMVILAKAPAAS